MIGPVLYVAYMYSCIAQEFISLSRFNFWAPPPCSCMRKIWCSSAIASTQSQTLVLKTCQRWSIVCSNYTHWKTQWQSTTVFRCTLLKLCNIKSTERPLIHDYATELFVHHPWVVLGAMAEGFPHSSLSPPSKKKMSPRRLNNMSCNSHHH